MILSLNEVEATTKRATRGLGHSWGMAEEAAKAVRWLCGRGLGGCEALASYLKDADGASLTKMTVQDSKAAWSAQSGRLCPLLAGATLSDYAHMLKRETIQMDGVVSPIFLLAFAAGAAKTLESVIAVEWNDTIAMTDGEDVWLNCDIDALAIGNPVEVSVRCVAVATGQIAARYTQAVPHIGSVKTLTNFAERTYAPATEESRLLGAGAGLGDND